MSWYNVVEPCVVGQLHYARPTAQPIKVDDEVAAPLVEAGKLEPYPARVEGKTGTVIDGLVQVVPDLSGDFVDAGHQAAEEFADGVAKQAEAPKPRPRRPRRTES